MRGEATDPALGVEPKTAVESSDATASAPADGPKPAGEVASPPPAVDAIGDGKEMDDSTYDDEAEGEDKAGDATEEEEDKEEEEEDDEDDEEEDQEEDEEEKEEEDEEEEDDEEEGEDEEDVAANDGQQNDVAANCIGEHCSDAMNEQMYRIVEDVALKAGLDMNSNAADAENELLAFATGASDAPHTMQEEATDERVAALTMTVMIGIVLLTVMLGVMLKHYKSRWLNSSGAALLLGIAVGCFVFLGLELSYETMPENMRYTIKAFAQCMRFDTKFFFLVLLPPLIFEAGYTLHPTTFFQNADAISMFAFVGSLTSAIATGVLMYVAGLLGWSYEFSLKSAMLFGALISSTDPVTTLSIFSESPISPDVHAMILGESILNDAVTIVYFESLLLGIGNAGDVTALEMLQTDDAFTPLILQAIGTFMLAFGQATAVGVGIGCFSALLHKYVSTTSYFEEGWAVDSTLVLLFPYLSYSLAESFELSGIVSVLFTGIIMGRYTRPNLARAPRMVTMCIFKIFSFLSETFVFVYMGSAMYSFRVEHVVTAIVGLVACYVGRAVNIFPGSLLLNMSSARKKSPITPNTQYLLWFCGLRGAVAFALAVKAQRDLGEQGHVMFDVTLFIVAFTIVIQGGMTRWVVDSLLEPTTEAPAQQDEPNKPRRNRSLGSFFRYMNDIAEKVIAPILLAKREDEHLDETTSLLTDASASARGAQREELGESPRSARHSGLASEAVEAAVDNTFSRDNS